jgi:hypothetical protein
VVRFTPRPPFTPGQEPPVPNVQEAGWDPETVWAQGSEIFLLPLSETESQISSS